MNNYKFNSLTRMLLLFFVYILYPVSVYSDSYFSVKGIEIEFEFDNDKDIRNLAIEEAQVQAMTYLSEKL